MNLANGRNYRSLEVEFALSRVEDKRWVRGRRRTSPILACALSLSLSLLFDDAGALDSEGSFDSSWAKPETRWQIWAKEGKIGRSWASPSGFSELLFFIISSKHTAVKRPPQTKGAQLFDSRNLRFCEATRRNFWGHPTHSIQTSELLPAPSLFRNESNQLKRFQEALTTLKARVRRDEITR